MQERGRVGRADTLRARILETPLVALDVGEFDYFEHDVADLAFERLRRGITRIPVRLHRR